MELNAIIAEIIKVINFHIAGLDTDATGQVATAVKSHLDKVMEDHVAAAEDAPEGPASDQAQGE